MTEVGVLLARLRADQRSRWQRGEYLYVEKYLDECPQLRAEAQAVLELIGIEIVLRRERGEDPTVTEYLQRFRELDSSLRGWFQNHPAEFVPICTRIISDSSLDLSTAVETPGSMSERRCCD